MTQMDYKYSLLGSTVDDYRKRPLLLQVDDTPMNLFAVLEVKRELPKRWNTLGCFRKIRLYSFLFGLAVTFLIMASYILTGDKKGLLLTPSPYHFSSLVSPGPFAYNLSSVKDYAHIKLVVKSITSKVEFRSSRQLPEVKALVNSEPHRGFKAQSHPIVFQHWPCGFLAMSVSPQRLVQLIVNPNDNGLCRGYLEYN